MFEHHRKSPWFAEKYDPAPEFQALRTRVRKVGWRGRMDAFVMDLESGKFDPDLTEAATDGGKEHLNGESSAANGVKTEAESAEEKPTGGDDDMQFNVEGEEDAGGDEGKNALVNKTRGGANRGEEVSVPPEGNQVMIRTIPPDIGRAKLEEVSAFVLTTMLAPADNAGSLSARFRVLSTLLWVTQCRNAAITAPDGSSSRTMLICHRS